MHQLEDELVLIFVLLKLIVVLILLEEKPRSELVSALDSVDVLVKAPLKAGCVRVNDVELFKKVEIAHVDHCAVHLTVAHISDFTEGCERGKSGSGRVTVQDLLEEFVSADCIEHLVVSELLQEKFLVQADSPKVYDRCQNHKRVRVLTI